MTAEPILAVGSFEKPQEGTRLRRWRTLDLSQLAVLRPRATHNAIKLRRRSSYEDLVQLQKQQKKLCMKNAGHGATLEDDDRTDSNAEDPLEELVVGAPPDNRRARRSSRKGGRRPWQEDEMKVPSQTQKYRKENTWTRMAIRMSGPGTKAEVMVKRSTFMLLAGCKLSVFPLWAMVYVLMGEFQAAFVPFLYMCLVGGNFVFAMMEDDSYDSFVLAELVLIFVFPFWVHLALGGFTASGGILFWSFLAPVGAAFFRSASESIYWWEAYIATVLAFLFGEWYLGSETSGTVFFYFGMNIVGVMSIIFAAACHFARSLEKEYHRSEMLLHNILPRSIADRIKMGENPIIDRHGKVTVLFADIVGFTSMAAKMDPELLIGQVLKEFFKKVDRAVEVRGLIKIKTIGDAYMVAGGLEKDGPVEHTAEMLDLAADMFDIIQEINDELGVNFQIRVGIHVGPVIAGVLGVKRFAYDVWGDSVNTAARMESHGKPGMIHLSKEAYNEVKHLINDYSFECGGEMSVKGKGQMVTFFAQLQDEFATSDDSNLCDLSNSEEKENNRHHHHLLTFKERSFKVSKAYQQKQ